MGDVKDSSFERSLQEKAVFATDPTKFGLPTALLGGGVILSVGIGVAQGWPFGVIIAIVFFYVSYKIHEHDPRAFDAWRRVMARRFHQWSPGYRRPVRFVFFPTNKQ